MGYPYLDSYERHLLFLYKHTDYNKISIDYTRIQNLPSNTLVEVACPVLTKRMLTNDYNISKEKLDIYLLTFH